MKTERKKFIVAHKKLRAARRKSLPLHTRSGRSRFVRQALSNDGLDTRLLHFAKKCVVRGVYAPTTSPRQAALMVLKNYRRESGCSWGYVLNLFAPNWK